MESIGGFLLVWFETGFLGGRYLSDNIEDEWEPTRAGRATQVEQPVKKTPSRRWLVRRDGSE